MTDRELDGMTTQHGNMPKPRKVTARVAFDELGETLSLEASGVMITVNLADINDMITEERNDVIRRRYERYERYGKI